MNKPAEGPKVHEPEQQIPASDTLVPLPEEPVHDVPPEIPDPSVDQINNNPFNTESSSPIKPAETHDDDVMITSTGFREPGRPTVLANRKRRTY